MFFRIRVPTKKRIIADGVDVHLSPIRQSWSPYQLGEKRARIGVYIIHHNCVIKYVGKTNGPTMNFGVRLRRHFQQQAAGKHTYPRLKCLNQPPCIQVTMIELSEIQEYVEYNVKGLDLIKLIPIFETALICAFEPEFQ